MSDLINDEPTSGSGMDASENGTTDVAGLPTSGTVQTETKPEDKPKTIIDGSLFSRIELPRITDSWSENKGFGTEMYKVYTVDDGTYFDESIVIDEYAKFLKKEDTDEDSSSDEGNNG